jgi:hypothetical protein
VDAVGKTSGRCSMQGIGSREDRLALRSITRSRRLREM